MATPSVIQITKTSKNKEKACIEGFLYTLNKTSSQLSHWVCEKRGTCKARLSTNDRIVVKPCKIADIYSSHSHGPDPSIILLDSKLFKALLNERSSCKL